MIVRACLLPLLLSLSLEAAARATPAPSPRGPLTEAEVVFLLQSGVTPMRVRALVERHGVAFELSAKVLGLIRDAGADAALLEALRRQPVPERPLAPSAPPAPPTPAATDAPSVRPTSPSVKEVPAVRPTSLASPLEPEMVLVPGGPTGDFYLGRFEATNRQYLLFCSRASQRRPRLPFWGLLDRHPVVNVTWHDAVAFSQWLARETGRAYRLPTATEWEHAARGGALAPRDYPWGDEDPLGRSCFGKGLLCPVGSYKANAYGLHDMAGSVAEWCADGRGGRRVIKGGSWASPLVSPETLAISRRDELEAKEANNQVGFRVARDP